LEVCPVSLTLVVAEILKTFMTVLFNLCDVTHWSEWQTWCGWKKTVVFL